MSTKSGLYASREGLWTLVLPTEEEQVELQQLIEDCKLLVRPQPQQRLVEILQGLVDRGAEALVLGCTDFPQLLPASWRPSAVLIDPLEELIELEPESKWPLASAIHISQALAPAEPDLAGRTTTWLHTLLKVDPMRATYYQHLLSQAA